LEVEGMSEYDGLGQTLSRAAKLYGGRLAVVDGERRVTYDELARRVGGLAGGLGHLGVAKGDVVAVLAQNSLEHLECWLGIPRCGAVLNDLNYRLAPSELAFILEDCEAVALIVDDAFLEVGRELAAGCASVRHLISTGDVSGSCLRYADLAAAEPLEPCAGGDELAGIFYTGGTTGLPKGVMLTHANLVQNAKHVLVAFQYRDDERYLHAGPMFHLADGASTYAVTWIGATHVIVPAFEAELVARTIENERVTTAMLVPTMINMLVNHPTATDRDLSSVRQVLYGGSPMPAELQRRAVAAIDCDWVQAYGMTEAGPIVSVSRIDHRRAVAGEQPEATRVRSAGTPVIGVQAEVRCPDGSRADIGEAGEIWVRAPNVMVGYWRRPEETEAVLDRDGWYHTGDAAYEDRDGYLYIVDRVKDMIISGGENVYPAEVENAIYAHPGVLEVAVFGVPDERGWGECVHAVVVPKPDREIDRADLITHCRSRIAGYKVPRSFEVRSEPLPKSGAGKVLKRELREPHWLTQEHRVS
jgi:long-chain acyl-CoA synthetase